MTFTFNPDYNSGESGFQRFMDAATARMNESREEVLMSIVKDILGEDSFRKLKGQLSYHNSNQYKIRSEIFAKAIQDTGYRLELISPTYISADGISKETIRVYKVVKK
jgi:hypothetical protein